MGAYIIAFHNLGDAVLAYTLAQLTQVTQDPWRTIRAPTGLMRFPDESQQPAVIQIPL
jgi:hypothetical protein